MKWCVLLAAGSCLFAQTPAAPQTDNPASEMEELRLAFGQANTSEIEVLRVIEEHLAKKPDSAFRPYLEHRAAEAAIALHNDALVVRYGEPSLARTPDDMKLLPGVAHSLLSLNTREAADHALKYTRRAEDLVRQLQKNGNPGNVSPIEWRNQTDRLLAAALIDDARAIGIMGHPDEALNIAQRAFDAYPEAAAVREISYWYEQLGKPAEAVRSLADAFAIPDAQATDDDRAKDRAHLGELYRKAKGSEEGLGALCLEAYDRDAALLKARDLSLHRNEPNAGRTNVLDFTLSGVDGKTLAMASLKGKVVVMDLWATWCIPCREQHPLYEQVKERYRLNTSVVFLSVNADASPEPVKPYLTAQKWKGPVYFEDGLARLYAVDGLPATIILDRNGKLFTHLNGYDQEHPENFVELLTARIRDALAN
jgi:thiol-disulfide isomerase/thioredoxin